MSPIEKPLGVPATPASEQSQTKTEKLSGKEKFEVVLGLFGTTQARDAFLATCREYFVERKEMTHPEEDAEGYKPRGKVKYSSPRRAHLHNTIMQTLSRLATESRNLTSTQESVLREFISRDAIAQAIKEYVLAERAEDTADDEDDIPKRRRDMSGPAYFHSLGREH